MRKSRIHFAKFRFIGVSSFQRFTEIHLLPSRL